MYCPQCGQLQVSDVIRFCSRCGFLLEGVTVVLANGGQVPIRVVPQVNNQLSPRSKGVRQGAMLMLSTFLVVPIMAILSVNFMPNPEVIVPLAAILCFVGGLLRILYAVIMEDAVAPIDPQISGYAGPPGPQLNAARAAALPPASANVAPNWAPRPNSGDIYQPPSITENTTRLLDKEDPKSR